MFERYARWTDSFSKTTFEMKYLLVIDHIATGGAEHILVDYYHYLEQNGHQVWVFCLNGHDGQSLWTKGMRVTYGADTDVSNILYKIRQLYEVYRKLKVLVKNVRPNVIFSFLEKSNLLTFLVPGFKAKKVLTVHNVLSIQYTKIKNPLIRKITYTLIRMTYNHCDRVVAVSKQVRDDLNSSFGVKSKNVHIINNYVNREDITEKVKEPIDNFIFDSKKRYVMNVGRFSNQKAQWKLLKAFCLYQKDAPADIELVLMGTGDYAANLKQLAISLGISKKVHFLPFNINPYKYLVKAHLFILSSLFEGFPIVLAEASFMRIPFVGSRKAIPEEVYDKKDVWEQSIYDNTFLEADFSTTIHEDERKLALLIHRGVEDDLFRKNMLTHTSEWETNNKKEIQFKLYDELAK